MPINVIFDDQCVQQCIICAYLMQQSAIWRKLQAGFTKSTILFAVHAVNHVYYTNAVPALHYFVTINTMVVSFIVLFSAYQNFVLFG